MTNLIARLQGWSRILRAADLPPDPDDIRVPDLLGEAAAEIESLQAYADSVTATAIQKADTAEAALARLRREAEAREVEVAALVEATREAQQLYVQADNEALRLRGEVERLDGVRLDEVAANKQAHEMLREERAEVERLRGEVGRLTMTLEAEQAGQLVAIDFIDREHAEACARLREEVENAKRPPPVKEAGVDGKGDDARRECDL